MGYRDICDEMRALAGDAGTSDAGAGAADEGYDADVDNEEDEVDESRLWTSAAARAAARQMRAEWMRLARGVRMRVGSEGVENWARVTTEGVMVMGLSLCVTRLEGLTSSSVISWEVVGE